MNMKMNKRRYMLALVIFLILGFLASGVFAATSIQVNSGNNVQLGAGATFATTCDDQVKVRFDASFTPTLLSDTATPFLHSIIISGIDPEACAGQKLSIALTGDNNTVYAIANWTIQPGDVLDPEAGYELPWEHFNGFTNPQFACGGLTIPEGRDLPDCVLPDTTRDPKFLNLLPVDIVKDMPNGGHIALTIEPFN
jgi:hypothetical protein